MSTNDVPGAKAQNNDVLAMGCWAEHQDGSLILVESVEANNVVYSIFDVAKDPPKEYRDAINEWDFKTQFSWDPLAKTIPSNIKWTWHDKTPFPWERVMEDFPSGEKYASASAEMSAAQRIGESLNLRAEPLRERITQPSSQQRPARTIMTRLKAAVEALVE